MPKDHGIGASTKRREDVRFLTGRGRYTDDIDIPGQAHVHFLRSDVAHGRLVSVDTAAAAAAPGVLRVFTGADFEGVGGLPCGWQVTDKHGNPMQEPAHPVLAQGKVRHVGDMIAAVVAESAEQARDAALAEVARLNGVTDDLLDELRLERQALADEGAVSDALHASLTVARADLDATEQARRAAVATNAALATQVTSLEEAVRAARKATKLAEEDAEAARQATALMRKLAETNGGSFVGLNSTR